MKHPRTSRIGVYFALLCSLCLTFARGASECSNLTGARLLRAVNESFETGSTPSESAPPFDFFVELFDVGLTSYCAGTLQTLVTEQTHKTLILIPDSAFERASILMNKGLEEILSDPSLVCDILESSIVHGSLDPRQVRDGEALETASTNVPRLTVLIDQETNIRRVRIYSELGPNIADVLATDIFVCSQLRAVFASELLLSLRQPRFFPSVSEILKSVPDLSTSLEAFQLTETLRLNFERNEYEDYNYSSTKSSVSQCLFDDGYPRFRAYFVPSNQAWRRFFRKVELTKSAVFRDQSFLLSILLYTEVRFPLSSDQNSLMSYLSTSFSSTQRLRSVGASSILSAFPGQVEVPTLRLDVDVSKIMTRFMKLSGMSMSSRFDNSALVTASDLVTCSGILHVIDEVLVPPTLTAFRQLSLRSDLSMFTEMIRAPVNSELLLELDTPSESNVFVDGVVFAPTNLAIKLTLTYLGWTFARLLEREALVHQFVTYHVVSTRSADGAPDRLRFRLGLLRDQQRLASRLNYPILSKRAANTFEGTAISKTLTILSAFRPKKVLPFAHQHTVRGRLNSARFIKSDIPSTNGGIGIINAALIPPTAELGMSLYDRVVRTPTLRIFREVINVLGLQREFRLQGFGNGDCTVFAPNNAAWLALLDELMTTQQALESGATAVLYDIIMLMVAPRAEDFGDVTLENYAPWQSKDAKDGDELPTALSVYTSTANIIRFGSLRRCIGRVCTPTNSIVTVPRINGPSASWTPSGRENFARIISPDMSTGQHALNGELYVVDQVILPRFHDRCRTADFTYRAGHAFELIDGRIRRYNQCKTLPCSYTLPGLYGRAGVRLSLEFVVTYDAIPICDSWCLLISWWWCIPCTGVLAQTVATIGGCAPYQPFCGGALTLFVTDAGQVRFGAQTFVHSYNNFPLSSGGGLRIVDVSVPGKGFVARDGTRFKVLCTYDGVSNTTKIYINDKLRGIADPHVMGQFVFQPFYNVSGNLHEKITLGNSIHSEDPESSRSTFLGMFSDDPLRSYADDGTFPGIGHFATYGASPLLDGSQPTQYFLSWRGIIHEAYVYFDNGLYHGIRYPSTCTHSEPIEPENDDFTNFITHRRRLQTLVVTPRVKVGPREGAPKMSQKLGV